MSGKVSFQKWIRREDLKNNPKTIYVFGDNMREIGMGGQAREMRGEPNAIGVVTKWSPSMSDAAFFSDNDLGQVKLIINSQFKEIESYLQKGHNVIFPEDGLGTGLSQLPTRAPKILEYIENKIEDLEQRYS